MENKFTEEDEKLLNILSDRPLPPFRVGDIVIRQQSEWEIYEKEIEPWENSTWVQVGKEIRLPEAVLGGERPRRHEVRGV